MGWWKSGTKFLGSYSGIQAFIASPYCLLTNCPPRGSEMITVLEDQSADGSDAAFIAYLVDPTPSRRRWYDHARTEPMETGGVTTHQLKAYPVPRVEVQKQRGRQLRIKVGFENLEGHAHVVRGEQNQRQSEGQAILSFDLLAAVGQKEPGRNRDRWKAAGALKFPEAAANSIMLGDEICGASAEPLWLAVGVTFVDGVESRLVGRAHKVDCSSPRDAG